MSFVCHINDHFGKHVFEDHADWVSRRKYFGFACRHKVGDSVLIALVCMHGKWSRYTGWGIRIISHEWRLVGPFGIPFQTSGKSTVIESHKLILSIFRTVFFSDTQTNLVLILEVDFCGTRNNRSDSHPVDRWYNSVLFFLLAGCQKRCCQHK